MVLPLRGDLLPTARACPNMALAPRVLLVAVLADAATRLVLCKLMNAVVVVGNREEDDVRARAATVVMPGVLGGTGGTSAEALSSSPHIILVLPLRGDLLLLLPPAPPAP